MPLLSYDIERDVNNDELYIAQHHLLYPDRLQLVKADLRAKVAKHEQDIQFLRHDSQFLRHEIQFLRHEIQVLRQEQQSNLTTQLNWETRSRIAQALNDTYVRQLLDEEEYINLKSNGHIYLPVVLSSWAVYTDREPATRLIGMDEIDDEAMGMHLGKAAALRGNGLEESVEFVWRSIPELERNIMISMFLTPIAPGLPIQTRQSARADVLYTPTTVSLKPRKIISQVLFRRQRTRNRSPCFPATEGMEWGALVVMETLCKAAKAAVKTKNIDSDLL